MFVVIDSNHADVFGPFEGYLQAVAWRDIRYQDRMGFAIVQVWTPSDMPPAKDPDRDLCQQPFGGRGLFCERIAGHTGGHDAAIPRY